MHSCLFEIRHIAEVKWVTNAVSCWLWQHAQLFWPMFNVLDQTCYIDSRIYSCTACHDQSTVQMCHAISSDPNKRYFLCVVISIIFSHESRNAGSLLQDVRVLEASTTGQHIWKELSLSLNIQGTKWILSALQVKQSTSFNIKAEISNALIACMVKVTDVSTQNLNQL